MEILYERCAGLDVHKKNVKVCLKTPGSDGRPSQEVRTYATMTQTILEMGDWLKEQGCSHVALESTGVYWKPRYNLLEEDCEILVVNAHHLKTVPVSPESAEESLSKPRLSWQAAIVLLMQRTGSAMHPCRNRHPDAAVSLSPALGQMARESVQGTRKVRANGSQAKRAKAIPGFVAY